LALPLLAGDQVLISPWDYSSVRAGWLQCQQRGGIEPITCQSGLSMTTKRSSHRNI
jgi:selenocysteine lyase/cysteine desulfurase